MSTPTIGQVFVPGGMPELTYVPRTERHLESQLADVQDNLCKLVVVTGATKTGKTVLVRKVLDNGNKLIWIDGGTVSSEEGFWRDCLMTLDMDIIVEKEKGGSSSTVNKQGGGIKASFLGLGFNGKAEKSKDLGITTKTRTEPSGTLASKALNAMKSAGAVLVIDDFHYLDRAVQGRLVRALKGEISRGFPAVVIAIPHRRYDAVRVEREMNGRLEPIKVPDWSISELREIATKGFLLLKMSITDLLAGRLASEAYGSPHLMQEFCKALAKSSQRSKKFAARRNFRRRDIQTDS